MPAGTFLLCKNVTTEKIAEKLPKSRVEAGEGCSVGLWYLCGMETESWQQCFSDWKSPR